MQIHQLICSGEPGGVSPGIPAPFVSGIRQNPGAYAARLAWMLFGLAFFGLSGRVHADDDEAFFEAKIRPVLVEHCYECHSIKTKVPKGGLRLDTRETLRKGGDTGPALIPGKPDDSLIIKALSYSDSSVEMPPKAKLPDAVLADFRRWVAKGAVDPRQEVPAITRPVGMDPKKRRDFWAFQVPNSPPVPAVKDTAWPRNEVDRFLLAKLESQGLQPVADADRYTWLRRVSIDLTGLPPSPEQITEFIADATPQAHERVVDRLLASAAFGERWARHWLDLTGYADQIGTANDLFAEHAWKYRDYTIAAFNSDKPFDQFLREQIAGDLLPHQTVEERASNLIATGFLLLGDLTVVEADKAKLRIDVIDQQIDKVSKAFLGLTVSCARCHDHKFDPISQRDYYALGGIFHSTESVHKVEWGVWSWPVVADLPETDAQRTAREAQLIQQRQRIEQLKTEREQAKQRKTVVATALDAKEEEEPDQPTRERLEAEQKELDARIKSLDTQIPHAEFFAPAVPAAFAVHDYPQPADMQITIRGNAHALGDAVPRGFVQIMSPQPAAIPAKESGRRQLAEWLVSPENPLTARVTVNRIWQKLFGEGIVRSVDYFGVRGELPSHPELLDYLATRFVADGWSQKRLIRELVLSHAYQLSSEQNPAASTIDPDNRLLWRMNRRRLDAESLRDSLLAASGRLMTSAGGPGLPLEYPENTGGLAKGGVNPPNFRLSKFRPEQEFVRTIYLPIIRSAPQAGPAEVRNVFDFTLPAEFAGQRSVTTVPTQALFLMNAKVLKQRARELAEKILATTGDAARLESLWFRVLNRPIADAERTEAAAFLKDLRELEPKADELFAWSELCHALLASNEFLVRM